MYGTNALGIKNTGKVELPESAKQLIKDMEAALADPTTAVDSHRH
jgi:hypothetical protein